MKTFIFIGGPMDGHKMSRPDDEEFADLFVADGGQHDGVTYERRGLEFHYRKPS